MCGYYLYPHRPMFMRGSGAGGNRPTGQHAVPTGLGECKGDLGDTVNH